MLTDAQMEELAQQLETGSFDWREWDGMTDPNAPEPVIIQFEFPFADVARLDMAAHNAGKTRGEYIADMLGRELATT